MFFVQINHTGKGFLFLIFREIKLRKYSSLHKIFYGLDFTTRIEKMSMGQQKRVALAKSLTEPANLYLWDEPANYLDVFNQDQLIKLLKSVKPTMLLIEHDPYFIASVADQQIKLTN